MPPSRRPASPRLRASQALALVALILAVVLLGTPGRREGQEAKAQTPPLTPRPSVAATVPYPVPPELQGIDLSRQTAEEAAAKSAGCVSCHRGQHDPHASRRPSGSAASTATAATRQATDKQRAHVWPRFPDAWQTSANPVRSYTLLNHESPEFIRFVNPGDLRVAHISCGTADCHPSEVLQNRKSMMTHGCMLWGAALYNNGSVPLKQAALRRELQHERRRRSGSRPCPPPTE